jgi:amino acid transporter
MADRTVTLPQPNNRVRLVVASTVMLTFISFWRAAAVVLNDLASSAFYAGGIAEQDFGKSAPWIILGVMLFSFAVRAVYVESCSMFTRGGVYRIVKEGLGGTFAKVSVSALMFDYVLTGPVSGVSAGQYIVGLMNELLALGARHHNLPVSVIGTAAAPFQLPIDGTSAMIAVIVTIYFWWQNIKGIEESSQKALDVMKITTVMVIIVMAWGIYSVLHFGASMPPLPTPSNLRFDPDAFGFLKHTSLVAKFGLFGVLMAFGHSVLAMSGEESLAQVNREIEHPKLKNLKRAAIVIALYSFIFTGGASLLAVMLIPDKVRVSVYGNNLIAGLAMYMVGPLFLRIALRIFVVIVGFLILAGAVNTSIIGSTGVLMRVAEDGVLHDWFRKPQKRFGTPSRIVNLVTILQLFTIIVSRGNIIVIGEAYAFGVIWSFTFNSLAMLVLRWKYHGERGWKVPLNLKIGGVESPIGEVATVSGILFALTFYIVFSLSEKDNVRRHAITERKMKEHFQLEHEDDVSREALQIRPGCVVVTMRDPDVPTSLRWTLSRVTDDSQDIVVLAARLTGAGGPEYISRENQIFSEHEEMVFTKAVSVAESYGKHISLLVVPAGDVFAALVQTALSLEASAVVAGQSNKLTAQEQAYHMGQAWEAQKEPKRQFAFYVVQPNGEAYVFHIGPHAPALQADDVQTVHQLWLDMRRNPEMHNLHHCDIVSYALMRLATAYEHDKQSTLDALRLSIRHGNEPDPQESTDGAALPAPDETNAASKHRRL